MSDNTTYKLYKLRVPVPEEGSTISPRILFIRYCNRATGISLNASKALFEALCSRECDTENFTPYALTREVLNRTISQSPYFIVGTEYYCLVMGPHFDQLFEEVHPAEEVIEPREPAVITFLSEEVLTAIKEKNFEKAHKLIDALSVLSDNSVQEHLYTPAMG